MLSKNTFMIVPTLFNYQSVLSDPITQIDNTFPQGGIELLSSYIEDIDNYYAVLNHGCWCAKLSDEHSDLLGGNRAVDELDEICKRWFTARRCNDHHDGGSCFEENFTSEISQFYTLTKDICNSNNNVCQMDSCTVDMHFSQLITDFVSTNSDWIYEIKSPNECPHIPSGKSHVTKYCHGEAPFKYFSAEPWGTAQQVCEDAIFDVTILVDGSHSIDQNDWNKAINFVKSLTKTFDIGPQKTRVTLTQFSENVKYYTRFAQWPAMVEKNVNLMYQDQYRKSTMTNVALNGVMNNMRVRGRPGVPQLLVLLTDGASSRKLFFPEDGPNRYNTAEKLHELGINSFVVAIGDQTDKTENREIASDPDSAYLHTLDNFDALDSIGMQISKMACGLSRSLSRSGQGLLPPTFTGLGIEAVQQVAEELTSDLEFYKDIDLSIYEDDDVILVV